MDRVGREIDSKAYWESRTKDYLSSTLDDYHRHRMEVIGTLIPDGLYASGRRIYDFGCGDADLFDDFLQAGAFIEGVDISETMIQLAHKNLSSKGHDPRLARLGTLDDMRRMEKSGYDAVISLNVLAYLIDRDEVAFYQEAARILKPGGYLVVTHSNELFDLFTFNRYTIEFFNRHFIEEDSYRERLPSLMTNPGQPKKYTTFSVRENPLAYRYKLAKYGFNEIKQGFMRKHAAPPLLLEGKQPLPDTLNWDEESRWKLMFCCSMFGSLSMKKE
ncbi:MAG: class I SAM-dependent methyltransferase [bacterium]